MRVGAFEVNEPLPRLKKTHALTILRPWIDVGSVGTLTLTWLEKACHAGQLAQLSRPGNFFDFTRYRPMLYLSEGRRQVTIPNCYINYAQRPTGNDFLFLHLLEPHMHSEVFIDSVLRLLDMFEIQRYYLVGSMYDFVPHTRPLLVTGGATGKDAEEDSRKIGLLTSDYEGPITVFFLVSERISERGTDSMSMIVHLPQYTQLDEDYIGVSRLMKIFSSLYDVPVSEGNIKQADWQYEQISAQVAKNPQVQEIIGHLEAHYDARVAKKKAEAEEKEEKLPTLSPEVEKFLREMERRFRKN